MPEKVNKCLNLEPFKDKDYQLTLGKMELTSEILGENILVNVDFPIKLTKEAYSAEENNFVYNHLRCQC